MPVAGWTRAQRLCFVLCVTPAAWLLAAWAAGTLGANALESLLQVSGRCALVLLLLTLAVGPLRQFSGWLAQRLQARWGRRLSDWNGLIEIRRQLGLQAFSYALAHVLIYLALDAGFSLQALSDDMGLRGHMLPGWLGLACLLLPAWASSAAARARLGAWWARVQLLGYAAAIAGVLHVGLQAKLAVLWPWGETLALLGLLLWRLWQALRGRGVDLQPASSVRLKRWRGLPRPPL